MSRIRTVKPDLFRHGELFDAEIRYQLPLRLSFVGLLTCCDREGRFRWCSRVLKLDILPYDDIEFERVLNALADSGFIQRYEVDGEYYGWIPSWDRHQVINHRESSSQLPEPPALDAPEHLVDPSATETNDGEDDATTDAIQRNAQNNDAPSVMTDEPSVLHDSGTREAFVTTDKPRVSTGPVSATTQVTTDLPTRPSVTTEIASCKPCPGTPGHARGEREGEKEREKEGEGNTYTQDPARLEILARTRARGVGGDKPPDASSTRLAAAHASSTQSADILAVFQHWRTVMGHPRAKLDPSRRALIRAALSWGYSVADLCEAITGCHRTPHNQGSNPKGERFDGLHVILRNGDQIDRFRRNAATPPRPQSAQERLEQDNASIVKRWLTRKREQTPQTRQEQHNDTE
jgi:hypothetical protein